MALREEKEKRKSEMISLPKEKVEEIMLPKPILSSQSEVPKHLGSEFGLSRTNASESSKRRAGKALLREKRGASPRPSLGGASPSFSPMDSQYDNL